MKQRLISALVGLVILFTVFMMFDTIVSNIAIAIISLLAVSELLKATGCFVNKCSAICALAFSALIPFLSIQIISQNLILICYTYAMILFITLLRHHDTLHIEQVALSFLFSLAIPFSLSTMIYMRNKLGTGLGLFYTLVIFCSAWLSDSGAYFCGRAFGKHKLAPIISPKKTVEGAIGGAITLMVLFPVVMWIYSLISAGLGIHITIYYWRLVLFAPLFSALSIVGDLSASAIKRQFNVKDYGSIMPGHGGVMDRFDSVLTVAPLVFIVAQYVPLAVLTV